MTHQTSLAILAAIDADADKDIGSVRVNLKNGNAVDMVPTPAPVVVPPHPAPPPVPGPGTLHKQPVQSYAFDSKKPGAILSAANFGVTDGGLLHANGGGEIITLANVFHTGNLSTTNTQPGCFFLMLWAPPKQRAKRLLWDNTGLAALLVAMKLDPKFERIRQNAAEAAFRCKVETAEITGVKFQGALDHAGNSIKQVIQLRDGDSFTFTDCDFFDSWVDIGQQRTKQPDGSSKFETAQHVKLVTFNGCRFHRWNNHMVYSRQPGVDKVVFNSCTDPSGHTFNRID